MDMSVFNDFPPTFNFSTGTMFGEQYYIAELKTFYGWWQAEKWARETFGHPSQVWELTPKPKCRWYINDSKFWFRDERDFAWFKMRWS